MKSILDHAAPETVQMAKDNIEYLRHGQFDQVERSLDPGVDRTDLHANLVQMAALMPSQDPISIKTVGAYGKCETRKGCDTQVSLEYQFPAAWILVQMTVHRQNAASTITDFSLQPESESLEVMNRFTLLGKQPLQYLILATAIFSFCLMLYALVLCMRTPMKKRKWLWGIFILFGACKVGVNWTTGEVSYRIFYVLFLTAGFMRTPYSPWMFYASFPLGALLFILLRNRLRKPAVTAASENDALPPVAGI
jgi:hypothetical protein